jgi:peptidyl-prolyl cis-trans isomerase SurA
LLARSDDTPVNGLAAVVDTRIITFDEVQGFTRIAREAAFRQYGRTPSVLQQKTIDIQRAGLEELIERNLILVEFERSGIKLPESIIEDLLKARVRELFGDRLTLTRTLQKTGETYEDFKRRERENLIIAQMRLKNVNSQIFISPKKIESFYQTNQTQYVVEDQIKLRTISLAADRRPAGEARQLAEDLVVRVRNGEKFADLATKYSDDAVRNKGGDRGWVENKEANLRKELREVAFKLEPGKVSEPVAVENFIFVMLVEEKKPAGLRPLNEVRNDIETTLRGKEVDRLRSNWVKRLRQKTFVRYF